MRIKYLAFVVMAIALVAVFAPVLASYVLGSEPSVANHSYKSYLLAGTVLVIIGGVLLRSTRPILGLVGPMIVAAGIAVFPQETDPTMGVIIGVTLIPLIVWAGLVSYTTRAMNAKWGEVVQSAALLSLPLIVLFIANFSGVYAGNEGNLAGVMIVTGFISWFFMPRVINHQLENSKRGSVWEERMGT